VDGVRNCIGPSDTVEIYKSHGASPLYGRILLTKFVKEEVLNLNDPDCPAHPYIHRREHQEPPSYFKVQLIIIKQSAPAKIVDIWPPINEDVPDTIPTAAPTNCVVWIHSSQIGNIIFFPHSHDCAVQTYGNLSGRQDLYHVDHEIIVSESSAEFRSLDFAGHDGYNMFGYPRRNQMSGYNSFTERTFESLSQITRCADSMLTKMGSVNGQVTKKIPLPMESFRYIFNVLQDEHQEYVQWSTNNNYQFKSKITEDNMTLSVAKSKATKWTITAKNVDGFEAIRSVIGRIGYGVKKKHPNLSSLSANDGSNRLTVQEQDTIHIVDLHDNAVLYRDQSEDDDIIYTGDNPLRPANNFIRLTYDSVNRILTLTVKCYTTLVSLLSPDSRVYLRRNNIVTGAVYVLHNNRVWKVIRVSKIEERTMLCDPDNEYDTIWLANDAVEKNEVRM
jgi:hypothetical protein